MAMQEGGVQRRHQDSRYIGSLIGCYIMTGTTKVFACRTRSISADSTVVDAPVIGSADETLKVRFDALGLFDGHVVDPRMDGFSIVFDISDEQRARLAARIDWIKRHSLKAAADRRDHKRLLPRNPHAKMLVGGQRPMNCLVIDVSQSGAALSAEIVPPIGTPLAVGTLLAKVVRHFESGFAVNFRDLQDLDRVEERMAVTTPEAKQRAIKEVWPALVAAQAG